jgi:hypothetical protein
MELTPEQIEAIAKSLGEQIGQNKAEDEPDWIKDVRRITGEESGRTKKEVEEIVNQRIADYILPMVKQSAMGVYLDGLEPEYHDTAKAMLKDEYEKNPDGLFRAGQHELTRKMVQDAARWQTKQAQDATKVNDKGEPIQEEVTTGNPVSLDKQGEDLSRLLDKAGVKKTGEEVMKIVEATF